MVLSCRYCAVPFKSNNIHQASANWDQQTILTAGFLKRPLALYLKVFCLNYAKTKHGTSRSGSERNSSPHWSKQHFFQLYPVRTQATGHMQSFHHGFGDVLSALCNDLRHNWLGLLMLGTMALKLFPRERSTIQFPTNWASLFPGKPFLSSKYRNLLFLHAEIMSFSQHLIVPIQLPSSIASQFSSA